MACLLHGCGRAGTRNHSPRRVCTHACIETCTSRAVGMQYALRLHGAPVDRTLQHFTHGRTTHTARTQRDTRSLGFQSSGSNTPVILPVADPCIASANIVMAFRSTNSSRSAGHNYTGHNYIRARRSQAFFFPQQSRIVTGRSVISGAAHN